MTNFELNLPTGAIVSMRPLKVKETDLLLSSKKTNMLSTLFKVLDDCTLDVIEYGVYDSNVKFSWLNAFDGDWFYALIMLRAYTFGFDYEVKMRCPSCGEHFRENVDLNNLEVKTIEDKEYIKEALTGDKRITINIPSLESTITVRFLTGKENIKQDRDSSMRKSSKLLENLFRSRVVAVNDITDRKAMLDWFNDLDMSEGNLLLNALDEDNFGINLTYQFECPSCEDLFEEELPLKQNFFQIAKKKKM